MRFWDVSLDWMAFFSGATPLIWLACFAVTAVAAVLLLCVCLQLWRELNDSADVGSFAP